MKKCAIEGCDKAYGRLALCNVHYHQQRKAKHALWQKRNRAQQSKYERLRRQRKRAASK